MFIPQPDHLRDSSLNFFSNRIKNLKKYPNKIQHQDILELYQHAKILANDFKSEENFVRAIAIYEDIKCLILLVTDFRFTDIIKEIDNEINDLLDLFDKNTLFDRLIKEGNSLLKEQQFYDAREKFNQANALDLEISKSIVRKPHIYLNKFQKIFIGLGDCAYNQAKFERANNIVANYYPSVFPSYFDEALSHYHAVKLFYLQTNPGQKIEESLISRIEDVYIALDQNLLTIPQASLPDSQEKPNPSQNKEKTKKTKALKKAKKPSKQAEDTNGGNLPLLEEGSKVVAEDPIKESEVGITGKDSAKEVVDIVVAEDPIKESEVETTGKDSAKEVVDIVAAEDPIKESEVETACKDLAKEVVGIVAAEDPIKESEIEITGKDSAKEVVEIVAAENPIKESEVETAGKDSAKEVVDIVVAEDPIKESEVEITGKDFAKEVVDIVAAENPETTQKNLPKVEQPKKESSSKKSSSNLPQKNQAGITLLKKETPKPQKKNKKAKQDQDLEKALAEEAEASIAKAQFFIEKKQYEEAFKVIEYAKGLQHGDENLQKRVQAMADKIAVELLTHTLGIKLDNEGGKSKFIEYINLLKKYDKDLSRDPKLFGGIKIPEGKACDLLRKHFLGFEPTISDHVVQKVPTINKVPIKTPVSGEVFDKSQVLGFYFGSLFIEKLPYIETILAKHTSYTSLFFNNTQLSFYKYLVIFNLHIICVKCSAQPIFKNLNIPQNEIHNLNGNIFYGALAVTTKYAIKDYKTISYLQKEIEPINNLQDFIIECGVYVIVDVAGNSISITPWISPINALMLSITALSSSVECYQMHQPAQKGASSFLNYFTFGISAISSLYTANLIKDNLSKGLSFFSNNKKLSDTLGTMAIMKGLSYAPELYLTFGCFYENLVEWGGFSGSEASGAVTENNVLSGVSETTEMN